MNTALTMSTHIGKRATLEDGKGITYLVTITDTRERWGQKDYKIEPIAGSGSRWVSEYTIKIQEGNNQ